MQSKITKLYLELNEFNEKESFCKGYLWLYRIKESSVVYCVENESLLAEANTNIRTRFVDGEEKSFGIDFKILITADYKDYPFDQQNISIKIDEEVKVKFDDVNLMIADPILKKWAVLNTKMLNNQPIIELKRKVIFITINQLTPIFLITCFSFTIYALDQEEIYQKLSIILTVLLTITAFKIVLQNQAPDGDQINYIDKYILVTYLVLVMLTVSAIILNVYQSSEMIIIIISATIWLSMNSLTAFNVMSNKENTIINPKEFLYVDGLRHNCYRCSQFYPDL